MLDGEQTLKPPATLALRRYGATRVGQSRLAREVPAEAVRSAVQKAQRVAPIGTEDRQYWQVVVGAGLEEARSCSRQPPC